MKPDEDFDVKDPKNQEKVEELSDAVPEKRSGVEIHAR